ncbi:Uncharacterised protein [uncultured archaeon]|nr:Uncharacterised protein [uncultured archaeon]
MQIITKENYLMTIISFAMFALGLIEGYMITNYNLLVVILISISFLSLLLIIGWFTIVKPDNYIPITDFRILSHPTEKEKIKFEWDLKNKSEKTVKIERYRIITTKDWKDHIYDIIVKPKTTYYEKSFGYMSASYYKIPTDIETPVTVLLYYVATDGKTGISESEVTCSTNRIQVS